MTLLDVPFADVRGDTLRWTLAPVRCTPLASRTVNLGTGLTVTLSVLGASHQVVVRHGEHPLLHETVACGIAEAAPLPGAHSGDGYRLRSHVSQVGPDELAERASALVTRLGGRTDAVVAHFPGDPHAVTALSLDRAEPAELTWRTWHTYPQTGEIVATTTSYRPKEVVSA
ncbi:uncharacterized protein DUF2617 [Nocardioides albertanoniae]|uniref:Uncharacterized protein DUF2617 n=1 Tax=Nocardioides albertanoniae TaxID=1175486 RepID=A0A543A1S3_9ACTN|nr:DUF2617 family protein [Nocardioides albertanoniae]TQL66528.1 uncharacterized protein DUF2617 [Nocardioides albertanoniae]